MDSIVSPLVVFHCLMNRSASLQGKIRIGVLVARLLRGRESWTRGPAMDPEQETMVQFQSNMIQRRYLPIGHVLIIG